MTIHLPLWLVAGLLLVLPLVFYVLYLAAINAWSQWQHLHPVVKTICAIPVAAMLLADVIFNATFFAIAFANWPREFLVTSRLKRYRSDAWPAGRRKAVATFICEAGLNPFDLTGRHC